MQLFLTILALVLAPPVFAFEVAPEYTFFHESEMDGFDGPEKIDGEYFSDVNTFRRPLSDPAQRWNMNNHYDLVVGSLSGKEFFENQKLFLSKKLLPQVEARFLWFRDRDFEQNHSQFTIELIYWLNDVWGIAANGSVAYEKSQNDLGLALVNSQLLGGEARAYINLPNFQLDKRSLNDQRWGEKHAPMALGFISRSPIHEVGFRYETPLELIDPNALTVYNFKRTTAQAKRWFELSDNRLFSLFMFYENKYEALTTTAGSAAIPQFRNRERISARSEWSQPISSNDVILGLSYENRDYTSFQESFRTENFLPYMWYSLQWSKHENYDWRWRLGWDSAFYDASHSVSFVTEDIDTYRIDGRVNVAVDIKSSDTWTLNFLLTFDADMQASDTLWEGGAAQFRLYF